MDSKGLIDCHTHCRFSPDGHDEPLQLAQSAAELGLSAWALTDHCECSTWFEAEHYGIDSALADADSILMYNCRKFHVESTGVTDDLRDRFQGKMQIINGVELGQPLQEINVAQEIVSDVRLDFIIGSLHNNAGKPDFYFLQYDKMSRDDIAKLLDDYFEQVLEMCRWGQFDILGHLTYPLRYISGKYGIDIDMSAYRDVCAEIFEELIKRGKGIEINTSGLFTQLAATMPDRELVKLYKDLGGEVISIGSDAHSAAKVGQGIAEGAMLAKECGFRYCAYFIKHRAEFVKL